MTWKRKRGYSDVLQRVKSKFNKTLQIQLASKERDLSLVRNNDVIYNGVRFSNSGRSQDVT